MGSLCLQGCFKADFPRTKPIPQIESSASVPPMRWSTCLYIWGERTRYLSLTKFPDPFLLHCIGWKSFVWILIGDRNNIELCVWCFKSFEVFWLCWNSIETTTTVTSDVAIETFLFLSRPETTLRDANFSCVCQFLYWRQHRSLQTIALFVFFPASHQKIT